MTASEQSPEPEQTLVTFRKAVVLTSPIDRVNSAADHISFLKVPGLPETSGTGNQSTDDESSPVSGNHPR